MNGTNKISNIDSQDEKITVFVYSITEDDRGIELLPYKLKGKHYSLQII